MVVEVGLHFARSTLQSWFKKVKHPVKPLSLRKQSYLLFAERLLDYSADFEQHDLL
jgi:hypothetical protein